MRETTVKALLEAAQAQGLPPRAAYSVRQAARLTGLGRDYLYGLVHAGRLKSHRVGRVYYVPLSELARLLSEAEEPERTPGPLEAQGR